MAIRLGKKGSGESQFRDRFVAEFETACVQIERGAGDAASLHEARKTLKRIRALLLVTQPALGGRGRSLRAALREPMQRLARHREMDALMGLLAHETRVAGSTDLDLFEAAVQLHHRVHASADRTSDLREALAAVRGLKKKVGQLTPVLPTSEMLERGFRRSVKQAREAFSAAATTPTPLMLHNWRKRSKLVINQMRLLKGWNRKEATAARRDLVALDDHLGRSRDMGILAGILVGLPAAEAPLRHGVGFRRRLEMVSREEARAALDLGAQIYRRKPRAIVERLTG